MQELLRETDKVTPKKVVDILRNREGLDEDKIGYGNEKALNQLLAHHGIVFQPEDLLVWVSSNPYQMERYRLLRGEIEKAISEETHLEQKLLSEFTALNPDFWEAHYLVGKYNLNKGYDILALKAFREAETKEITTLPDREMIEKHIRKLSRKLGKKQVILDRTLITL